MGSYGPSSQSQQYATIAQLIQNGMSQQALSSPSIASADVQNAALLAASEVADSYLRQQFQLPLKQWGADLVQHVCWLAAYRLICIRGFSPTSDLDASYAENDKLARAWFRDVAKALASPDITDSSSNASPGAQAPAAQPLADSPDPQNAVRGSRGTWAR